MNQKSEAKRLLVAAATFAASIGVSALLGGDALKGCLWAVVVATVAGSTALVWNVVLLSGVIRLLLMLGGTIVILCFVNINVLWFIGWLGLFYAVFLIMEVWFALLRVN